MNYDQKIFAEFRAKAITDVKDLVIGDTYYCTSHGVVKLHDLLTQQEAYKLSGIYGADSEDNTQVKWMLLEFEKGGVDTRSLADINIGNSYNPWLMFANKEDYEACSDTLKISWSPSNDHWDSYDFLGHDYDYDEELR